MSNERERRKWLIVAIFALVVWVLAISGIIALVERSEISALAISMLVLALIVAALGFYAGRSLMRLSLPPGRPGEVFGLFLYTVYIGVALVLIVASLPLLINIPELASYPGYSLAKVAGAGAVVLGIAVLISFIMWHRAYLHEIESLGA
ncbi:MAG: hypothetical protein ACE5M4_03130 [Anaerolineales bacterium]